MRLSRASILVATLLSTAPALEAAADHFYYYYDEPQPLALSLDHVAVLHEQPLKQAVRDDLARLGLAAAPEIPWDLDEWEVARTPATVRDERDLRALQTQLLAEGPADFVSPVFHDEYGPQIVKPFIHVGFHRDVQPALAEMILAESGAGVIVEREWGGMPLTYRLRAGAANGLDVLADANALAERPEVMWAQPGRILTVVLADVIPNDTFFGAQWGLHNTGQSGGWVDLDMDLPEAWDIEKGSIGTVVVVMDTGVQQNHPDINQVTGHDFAGSVPGGGPGNACDNHGTAVAGTVTAIMNNGIGIAGVAPQCLVTSARVVVANTPCDGAASGDPDDIVDAIQWAQNLNYAVTTASLEFGWDSAVAQKYADTRAAGLIHFAATGNAGNSTISFPASAPAVNAVTGVNRFGNHYGNYGTGTAYTAPAVDVPSTDRTGNDGYVAGDYVTVSGTSFASPQAAGVAALVIAVDDTITPDEVDFILQTTSTDLGTSGYDTVFGWGLLNAHNGVLAQLTSVCGSNLESCYVDNPFSGGCDDPQCCTVVCDLDPFCCFTHWDLTCAETALELCSTCGQFGAGDCFAANGNASCDDLDCCTTVCLIDPYCCETSWDAICVGLANVNCAPANNACADATAINAPGNYPFDNTNATMDGVGHNACFYAGQSGIDGDVWYCFTAPLTGNVTVSTCGLTTVDTKIAVYYGCTTCPPGDADLYTCNDDSCSSTQSEVTFAAITGATYMVRLGSYPGAAGGTGSVAFEYLDLGADVCSNAPSIAGAGTFFFDNSVATTDGPDHLACLATGETQIERDVWFCWTSPADGQAVVSTCVQTAVDTKIAAYEACGTCPPGDGQLLDCSDDDCSVQSQIGFLVAAGQPYLLRIGVYPNASGGNGTFTIDITAAPPNDDCAEATAMSDGTIVFDTALATTDGPALPPSCNEGSGLSFVNDVWYLYTAPCTGTVTVDVCDSGYDTRLAVYNAEGCPGVLMACNDDLCGLDGLKSRTTFQSNATAQYLVRVGGFSGGGTGTLTITCQPDAGCTGDLNGSGAVDTVDLLQLLGVWGTCPGCPEDLDGDGAVATTDLLDLLGQWGNCP